MSDLDEVAVMALLHDVREVDEFRERLVSAGSSLGPLVAEASGLASRREEPERGSGDLETPLRSIFDFVGEGSAQHGTHRLQEYGGKDLKSYLPTTETEGSYQSLRDTMVAALRRLDARPDPDMVMNILERYGSCMRSTMGGGDVSLFDHSRTTAAIAVCIAGCLDETGAEARDRDAPRYLFVRGDISGVQKFIYTITSKGALRMLRARSFFLELVAEHAVAEILRGSGVTRTNVVLAGGGGFQLLLPNTQKAKEAVETVEKDLNADLESRFGHGLYLALAKSSCGASGIAGEGLTQTLTNLGKDLSEKKARKFHESLPRLFGEQNEPGLENCDVCARDDVSIGTYESKVYKPWRGQEDAESIELCETCHMLAQASLKLVRSKYLVRGSDLHVAGTGHGLSGDRRNALYALDGVGDEACLNGAVPLPAARYAMRDGEGQIMDFKELSKRAAGVSRLAVMRMDVDNLGELFRSGLPENLRTFDRYAALSRSFTTFFKMVVPLICAGGYENSLWLFSEKHERAATVVYSGGDDLFIVGAWSDVLELAVDIRRAFREFVCDNPSVTLSGGISIHKPGEPLYLMAEAAGAAEEAAKQNKKNGRNKDSAVLFYEGPDARKITNTVPDALFWDEVEGVVSLLERINTFRKDGKLPFPRGFTRLLLEVVDVYEQEGHLSLPKLAYALARMEESGKLKENSDWQELKRKLLKIETVEKYLRPAATWLDLAERQKED